MKINYDKLVREWSERMNDRAPIYTNRYHRTVLREVMKDFGYPLELLGESEVPQLSMSDIRKKISNYVVANFKTVNGQSGPESWLVPDPDDEDLFNKIVKKIKSGLKDYVKDAELISTKSKADKKTPNYYENDGISNTFMYIAVQIKINNINNKKLKDGPNQWIHFKLNGAGSKSTGDGAPSQAARYEEGIVLWHNTFKLHKGNHADALAKASDYGISNMKTYNNFAGHMEKTFGTSKTGQINGVGKLNHSGAVSFSIKADASAGYVNKTAKSDIYDDSGNDISVKKKGGSQLMSGKVGDSTGVFYGALRHYLSGVGNGSSPLEQKIDALIQRMRKEFGNVTGDTGTRDIKKRFGEWYVKERKSDTKLVNSIKNLKTAIEKEKKPSDADKDAYERITGKRTIGKGSIDWGLERHAKWEAMEAAMIDRSSSKWEEWQIPGAAANGKSMDKYLDDYVKNHLAGDLGKEAKDVIKLNQIHVELEKEVMKVFQDKEFLKYVVYEAGSGWYKFEGKHNNGMNPVKGTSHGSANKLLYFTKSGVTKKLEDIDEAWAKGKISDLKINLGYKSSGKSKFTALRLLQSHLEKDGNLLTESEQNFGTLFEYDMDKVLNGELKVLQEEINNCTEMLNELYLMEGFFSKMGTKLKKGISAIKKMAKKILKQLGDAVKKFWETLKEKVFNTLLEYLKKGFDFFMDALGADVSPTGDSIELKA